MSDPAAFSVLCEPTWSRLLRRLEESSRGDLFKRNARGVVLRPAQLLEMMAALAPLALAEDILAQERLRTLLYLAARGAESPVELNGEGEPGSQSPLCRAGLLHPGALVILGIAALRVADQGAPGDLQAAEAQEAREFLTGLLQLALDAAAVEILSRFAADEAEHGDPWGALLLMLGDTMRAPPPGIDRDPIERARRTCLRALFSVASGYIGGRPRWSGAHAYDILEVRPGSSAGRALLIIDESGLRQKGLASDGHTWRDGWPEDLLQHPWPPRLHVVFCAPDQPPLRAEILGKERVYVGARDEFRVEVAIPAGAAPGWIGFVDQDWMAEANQLRAGLREHLHRLPLRHPCLRVAPVPAELPPDLTAQDPLDPTLLLAAAPRTGRNCFHGGAPRMRTAVATPAVVAPDGAFTLSWESDGATAVLLSPPGESLPPAGRRILRAPAQDQDLTLTLLPRSPDADGAPAAVVVYVRTDTRIEAVEVTQGGRAAPLRLDQPLDVALVLDPSSGIGIARLTLDSGDVLSPSAAAPGRISFQIPAEQVRPGLGFTLTLARSEGAPPHDRRHVGPLSIAPRPLRTVVALRPQVVGPRGPVAVAEDALRAAADAAEQALGVQLDLREPPWLPPALAAMDGPIGDAADPRLPMLFEELAGCAARAPGLEQALWIALVPDPGSRSRSAGAEAAAGLYGLTQAPAAAAVAVATPVGLAAALMQAFPAAAPAAAGADEPARRLRLLGELADGAVTLSPTFIEERAGGGRAPIDLGLVAVCLDAGGTELLRQPIWGWRASRPARFVALLQAPPVVAAVELRSGDRVLASLQRRLGRPSLSQVAVAADRLSWRYAHPAGCRPTLTLEVGKGGLWAPLCALRPCGSDPRWPRHRLRQADRLRLRASDGWEAAVKEIALPLRKSAAIIRPLSSGRYLADLDPGCGDDAAISWTLDGQPIPPAHIEHGGRVVSLDPRARGTLRLSVGPAAAWFDEHVLAGGDGDAGL